MLSTLPDILLPLNHPLSTAPGPLRELLLSHSVYCNSSPTPHRPSLSQSISDKSSISVDDEEEEKIISATALPYDDAPEPIVKDNKLRRITSNITTLGRIKQTSYGSELPQETSSRNSSNTQIQRKPQTKEESQTVSNAPPTSSSILPNGKQLRYLLCGAVAGAVSRTCTAPLDRLKVLLQTTTQIHSGNPAASVTFRMVYRSISDGMIKIYREGGIRSFWRGNGLNCLKIIPESAMKFYVFEQSKIYIARFKSCQIDEIGVSGRFLAGGFGGFVSQFSIYPIETLKTRIMAATQSPTSPYKGMGGTRLVSVISKQLWREGKIKPFFRGLTPSLFGIVPYAGLDLGIYESLKTFYAHMVLDRGEVNTQPSVPLLLLFGTISGSIGAVAVYPLSLVRTRLQAQGTYGLPERYTGALDVIRKTYAKESIAGFYKGLAPTLIKVIPAASISYVVYEGMKKLVNMEQR